MKKILNHLRTRLHISKNLFVFLLVLVIVGVAAGSFFASILGEEDKRLVLEYLNGTLTVLKQQNRINH